MTAQGRVDGKKRKKELFQDSRFLPSPTLSPAVNHLAAQQSSVQHSFPPLGGDGGSVTCPGSAGWKALQASTQRSHTTAETKAGTGNCGGI